MLISIEDDMGRFFRDRIKLAVGDLRFYGAAIRVVKKKAILGVQLQERLQFWDLAAAEKLGELSLGPKGTEPSWRWSRDGTVLATLAWEEREIVLREMPSFKKAAVVPPEESYRWQGFTIQFLPDGKTLGVIEKGKEGNSRLVLVATTTGKRQTVTTCDAGGAWAVSDDRKLVATSGEKQTIHVWDAELGRKLLTFKSRSLRGDYYSCLAFSPNRKVLAAGSSQGALELWPVAEALERKADN
jgi:hypothetical protein